jgi:hypothetical protein
MKQVVLFHVTRPPVRWWIVVIALILFQAVSTAAAVAYSTNAPVGVESKFYLVAGAPIVTGISPASGPVADGTTVTITGLNFHGATAVYFGPTPATNFVVFNDLSITATAPANTTAGAIVDVTVTTPADTSAISRADEYTYSALTLAPTVTVISPTTASTVVTTMIPMATRAPLPAVVSVIASGIAVLAIVVTKRK